MTEHEFRFYTEDEIKEIINAKEELYFMDNGIEEVIIRLEDIPDAIVDINRNIGRTDLSFYKLDSLVYEPELITLGENVHKITLPLNERIVDRLVFLQTGECSIKHYKLINEDLFEEINSKIEQEKSFKAKTSEKKKRNKEAR